MKQIPKKIGLPETCILVQNFLRTYGFRKSAEMFSEESLSHQNKVVYKKEKKVKDLIDIINHYLCINVQEDVKTEIKNLTQKLQFLLHNYSSFRYSHKDSANLENFAISNKNAENNEENSKKDLKIKKRRKTTSPKKRHLKQNAKDHIKSSLLDRMITNEDFAVGLADAINKTKFENTLDDENPIDFDNLSFSQDYYGKVFNAMTEDQRIQKTLGGIVNVTSKGKFC
ncbi:hypothetical protein MHBO_000439 [Bonamia ostreae]|uniref:LisH domain-containing protein n=1 Tax=Bonamia ostreae TaxID=126728 RepID=A0ABV2AG79_9EUKA